ncbi:phage-associated protein [Bradyrhizobium lupini HPC(L)]|uniref:Phage-associated protein n=1 Tax=Bradyrhizobium lupini HPC(L) TaxID=1229491 RepID=A0ABN0HIC8_RHILU|nr:phage-associated protein [Bradyrhizobium lupini HPC(L)]
MPTINDTSDYIVFKLRHGGVFVNVLKLHKLMYYVQAWHLAFGRGQFFPGRFQAWVHGPVSRELYDRYKDAKNMYSSVELSDIQPSFDPDHTLSEDEKAHLNAVLDVYAGFTGDQLEEMTHREEPWLQARAGVSSSQRSENYLSDETMRAFYAARLPQNA